jgi:plasmid stabilization system protein ParE
VTTARVSPDAEDDIAAIGDFIARTSAERAVAFADLVYGRIDSLAIFPTRGSPRPEFGARMRSFPVRPATVFYRVASDESEVIVLRVIVGGRNLESIFGPTI